MLRYVHPDGIVSERLLIAIKFPETAASVRIHGGILLMAKDHARTRYALAGRFGTLAAYRFLLVTFQLDVKSVECSSFIQLAMKSLESGDARVIGMERWTYFAIAAGEARRSSATCVSFFFRVFKM